jgi:hypothetical protein
MLEPPPAIIDLGPSSGWSLPATDRWRLRDCGRGQPTEIIVCGRREPQGVGALGPDRLPLIQEIENALTIRLAPGIDLRPGDFSAARSNANGIRLRIRF